MHKAQLSTKLRWIKHSIRLVNPVQPSPVHSNLIINLVRLLDNPINMSVLRFYLLTHGFRQRTESRRGTI